MSFDIKAYRSVHAGAREVLDHELHIAIYDKLTRIVELMEDKGAKVIKKPKMEETASVLQRSGKSKTVVKAPKRPLKRK